VLSTVVFLFLFFHCYNYIDSEIQPMALILDNNDLNGECFILGAEGEIETDETSQVILVPDDAVRPQGWPHNASLSSSGGATVVAANAYLTSVLWLNYNHLTRLATPHTPRDAFRIAYIRMLVVREGLVDPSATPQSHHARYNLCRFAAPTDSAAAPAAAPEGSDNAWRTLARQKFTNMICIVAYFFRVRGHHFQDNFEDRYKAVWRKCLYNEDDPGLRWEYVARQALHCIFPDVLDIYWQTSANASACAGALIKRLNSSPAGIAGVAALRRGLDDIAMILPKVPMLVPDAVFHLREIETLVAAGRWNGSINRRFYNADAISVDEGRLGSLAAVILAALDQFAGSNPLAKSNALKRIASNAPITGAVVARLISTAVNNPAAASGFITEVGPEGA